MSNALDASEGDELLNFLLGKVLLDKASKSMPWYDSQWLRQFVASIKIIEQVRPHMRDEFIQAFAPLRTRPDFSVRELAQVFDQDVMDLIRTTIRQLPSSGGLSR
jgi:hypothetical protein